MFYYRIEVGKRLQSGHRTEYIESLSPAYVGEKVASILTRRPFRVEVEPISQADYIAATRPGD